MKFSPYIEQTIQQAAAKYGVDPQMMRAFAHIESSGNPYETTGAYHGLFQLSAGEFRHYGGQGNIFNAQANAEAAALKLKAESDSFSRQYGRAPSAGELYMIHNQGEAGARAHWQNPDQAAWVNMWHTAEGRQKGPGWAQRAVWGNLTDADKQRFGSVQNVSSRDFTGSWNDKVARAGAGTPSQPVNMVWGGPPDYHQQTDVPGNIIATRRDQETPQTPYRLLPNSNAGTLADISTGMGIDGQTLGERYAQDDPFKGLDALGRKNSYGGTGYSKHDYDTLADAFGPGTPTQVGPAPYAPDTAVASSDVTPTASAPPAPMNPQQAASKNPFAPTQQGQDYYAYLNKQAGAQAAANAVQWHQQMAQHRPFGLSPENDQLFAGLS